MNALQYTVHTKIITDDNYNDNELAILTEIFKDAVTHLASLPIHKAHFHLGDYTDTPSLRRAGLALERFNLGEHIQWHGHFKDGNKKLHLIGAAAE